MTTLRSGAASLVGQVRGANEDSYLVTDDLVAVADGMGGHRAGEVASADTVDVLRDAAGSRSVQDLVAAVHRANRRIHERRRRRRPRGMGTTVCVAGLVRYDDRKAGRGAQRRRFTGLPDGRRRADAPDRGPLPWSRRW